MTNCHDSHRWFPRKTCFQRKKNPTKPQKASGLSGSCVVLNSFLTDNLLILWTPVLIHLSLWFLAFSSKSNRILPVLLNVAWPTQLWLLVPTLLVKICSLLFYQGEDEMKTWSSKRTWYSLYPMTWMSLAKNKAVLHFNSHMSPGPKPWKFWKKEWD